MRVVHLKTQESFGVGSRRHDADAGMFVASIIQRGAPRGLAGRPISTELTLADSQFNPLRKSRAYQETG